MAKNVKLLEAAMTQLRGRALEHLAIVDILLENPAGVADHTNYVKEIITHTREVMICENSLNALQMYFVQQPEQAPPVAPSPPPKGRSVGKKS